MTAASRLRTSLVSWQAFPVLSEVSTRGCLKLSGYVQRPFLPVPLGNNLAVTQS